MMPAEHKPASTRGWYKVRWTKDLPGKALAGKIDLLMDEDLKEYADFISIIKEVRAKTCVTSPVLGFGKLSEGEIDRWIEENKI